MIDLQASEDSGASERDAESDEDKKIQKELEFLKQLQRVGIDDDREPFSSTSATYS